MNPKNDFSQLDRQRDLASFAIAAVLYAGLLFGIWKLLPGSEAPAMSPVIDSAQFTELQFTDTDPVEQARAAEAQRQAELAEQQRQQELAEQQRQQELAEQQRQQEIAEQQKLAEQQRIEQQKKHAEEKRIAEAKERQRQKELEKQKQAREKQRQKELAEKRRQQQLEAQRQAQLEAQRQAQLDAQRRAEAAAAQARADAAAAQARAAAAAQAAANGRKQQNELKAYADGLRAAIQRQVNRSGRARSTGTATVTFNVSASGQFSSIRTSGGNNELQQRAASAVQTLGHYRSPPGGARTFSVPVRFTER